MQTATAPTRRGDLCRRFSHKLSGGTVTLHV